jgi:hypothetical protein
MGKKSRSGSGIQIRDEFTRAYKQFLVLKILKFFDADPDQGSGIRNLSGSGSGIEKSRIRDSG